VENDVRLINKLVKLSVSMMTVVGAALGDGMAADAQTVQSEAMAIPVSSNQNESNQESYASNNQDNVSHIGNAIPEPPESMRHGPLASLGQRLNDWGVTPSLNLTQIYLGNPSAGQQPGNHEILTFIAVGGDFDLQKIAGFPGATIHFQQVFAPFTTNVAWGNQVGDTLGGKPGPFVPKKAHLAVFTWEQKAFHDRLDVEVGKSSPDNYFALPVCNQGFGCTSALLYDSAGMNPPIYPNWSARVRYNLTPAWSIQAGVWRSNPQYPWTNGWEWTDKTPDSNAWLANVVYHTTYQTDPYPRSYELMFYYNTATQTDSYTSGTHKGTSGVYFGGRQVVYRPDGGKSDIEDPTAVALFATATGSLDSHNSDGLSMTGTAGITVEAPLRSRPHDSVSLSLNWATVTPHNYAYLQRANLAAGETGYTVGRTEYGLRLDANIELTRSVVFSPYVMRTWRMNAWLNPAYTGTPKNGIVFGVLASVFFDKMLGLSDH
jgi:porin